MPSRPVRDVPLAVRQLGAAALRVRGPVALTRFLRSDVLAGKGVPHGDGRPVVLLPPAAAGDWLMPVMLGWLRRIGYAAHRSSISLHVDCSDRTMSRVLPRVEEIAGQSGRPVTLLGHSRGGLLSRALATARPDLVERVITLASPLNEPFAVTNLTLAAAAARVRLVTANGSLSGLARVMTRSTRSGRAVARARDNSPPRLWPRRVTGRPLCPAISSTRGSTLDIVRSEQSTCRLIEDRWAA